MRLLMGLFEGVGARFSRENFTKAVLMMISRMLAQHCGTRGKIVDLIRCESLPKSGLRLLCLRGTEVQTLQELCGLDDMI